MFLLKLGTELQNLIKRFQFVLKIQIKCRIENLSHFKAKVRAKLLELGSSISVFNLFLKSPHFYCMNKNGCTRVYWCDDFFKKCAGPRILVKYDIVEAEIRILYLAKIRRPLYFSFKSFINDCFPWKEKSVQIPKSYKIFLHKFAWFIFI